MDEIKVVNYEREHGSGRFPAFWALGGEAKQHVQRHLAHVLGIHGEVSGAELCRAVQAKGRSVEGVNAEDEGFDLGELLDAQGITPAENLYLNWYRYDDIDVMQATDVFECFTDLWYPSSDDLDVLDQGLDWILSISHHGAVRIARIASGSGKDSNAGGEG